MPIYIAKQLEKYKHQKPSSSHNFPLAPALCAYGKAAQKPTPSNASLLFDEKKKFIQ